LSTERAEGSLYIIYYDEQGRKAGGVAIWNSRYTESYEYWLVNCHTTYHPLKSVPAEKDKVWTIEKHGYKNTVYCNGNKVVEVTASSDTCTDRVWEDVWGRKVSKIKFSFFGPGSLFYTIGELLNFVKLKQAE
jgi:hypothetical protein